MTRSIGVDTLAVELNRAIYADDGDPLSYPCEMTAEPVLVQNDRAIPIHWTWPEEPPRSAIDGIEVNELLENSGEATLEQRVAQIAFGANRDISNVLWKFRHYAGDKPVSSSLVVIPGFIEDCDVVACNIGYWGYIYAALLLHRPPDLRRPYLIGSRAPVCVLLLDHDQMQCMHASEGVVRDHVERRPNLSCDVAHQEVRLVNGVVLLAQLYALALPYLSFDGLLPVPFSTVATLNRHADLSPMTQVELLEEIAKDMGLEIPTAIADSPALWAARVLRLDQLNGTRERLELYTRIRSHIIEHLCLRDEDGAVRCGNADLAGLLPLVEAWSLTPTLALQY